jgi:pyrroline-5-carboxylate reductase
VIVYDTFSVSAEKEAAFCRALAFAGLVEKLDESKIDAASALHGCGPAFVYLFLEALADGGVASGLPRDKAILYAAQTLAGTAALILGGEHPAILKDKVTSPGGTTIAGVGALEDGGFRAAVENAVKAGYKRAKELS